MVKKLRIMAQKMNKEIETIFKVGIWSVYSTMLLMGGLAVSLSVHKYFLFGYGVGLIIAGPFFISHMLKKVFNPPKKVRVKK